MYSTHNYNFSLTFKGDFHFVWECLQVVLHVFWGSSTHRGSLCNLRDVIHRVQVDKKAKVFSIGNEFVLHAFWSHLIASICSIFNITSVSDVITHECSLQWLEGTAESITEKTIMPAESLDPIYAFHQSFLYAAFLYSDLHQAVRFKDGEHVVRHWKLWLQYFLGTGQNNYATEAANLIRNLQASFPKHIAYIVTHNRTVNVDGKQGHGKPIDQMLEHYNL